MERILFIWAIRHPASGYVQGMNDLVTPFMLVFLSEHVRHGEKFEKIDMSRIPEEASQQVNKDNVFLGLLYFLFIDRSGLFLVSRMVVRWNTG